MIDDEAAEVVRKIFHLCIDGYGPSKIARILTQEGIPTPTADALSQGRDNGHKNAKLHRWGSETIAHILEKAEYCGHTVNFRTHVKSYKNKKRVDDPKEDRLIFENTHDLSSRSRSLIWCRSFARTNAVRPSMRKSIRFQISTTVLTVDGKCICAELTAYFDTAEQKSADVTAFIRAVQKYEHITELTPEIMHELIEKIVVHAPDKSSGHRTQEIEIHYRFDIAITTAVADSMKCDKKRKAAYPHRLRDLIFKS